MIVCVINTQYVGSDALKNTFCFLLLFLLFFSFIDLSNSFAERPNLRKVSVSTVEQLFSALRSNTHITLTPGDYVLSPKVAHRSEHVVFISHGVAPQMNFSNLRNVVLEGNEGVRFFAHSEEIPSIAIADSSLLVISDISFKVKKDDRIVPARIEIRSGEDIVLSKVSAAGVSMHDAAATFIRSVFRDSREATIAFLDKSGPVTFEHCLFEDHKNASFVVGEGSSVEIVRSVFRNNSSSEEDAYLLSSFEFPQDQDLSSTLVIEESRFEDNGFAWFIEQGSRVEMNKSVVLKSGTVDSKVVSGSNNIMPELLAVGDFELKKINVKSGERWWGILKLEDSFKILPYKIVVQDLPNPLAPQAKSIGTRVSVDSDQEPLVLFRGLPETVMRAFKDSKSHDVTPQDDLFNGFLFPGVEKWCSYRPPEPLSIFAVGKVNVGVGLERLKHGASIRDYELHISSKHSSQRLFSVPMFEGGGRPPRILWAGDLDGDGELDLVIDTATSYITSHEIRLYLSSVVQDGELLHESALFRNTVC